MADGTYLSVVCDCTGNSRLVGTLWLNAGRLTSYGAHWVTDDRDEDPPFEQDELWRGFVMEGVGAMMDNNPRTRPRYRFKCSACGEDLQATYERLAAAAGALLEHGRTTVSITGLRGVL